jgi:hypothetical protein
MSQCFAFTWSEWRLWEIFAWVVAGGIVLITLLVFFAALLEKRRLRPLIPIEPGQAKPMPRECVDAHEAALSAGFVDFGMFTDGDKGLTKGFITLLLSPEEDVLVLVQWGTGMKRFRIQSNFAEGTSLVTSNTAGEGDLTGQQELVSLHNAKLLDALNVHYDRIVSSGQAPHPFDADALPEQLIEQLRQRVDRLIEKGLAKYLNVEKDVWRYKPWGAVLVAANVFRQLIEAMNQGSKAKTASKTSRVA